MEQKQDIAYQINLLTASGQFQNDFIQYYEQILTFQQNFKNRIDKHHLLALLQTIDIDRQHREGQPLFNDHHLYIERQVLETMLQELVPIFQRFKPQEEVQEIQKIMTAWERADIDLIAVLKKFPFEKKDHFTQIAKKAQIKPELLQFISRTFFLPLIEAHRETLQPDTTVFNSIWSRPYCPTCGSLPAMGRLEQEVGQKLLWCALCNSQWSFHRLQCPFCMNTDQTMLRFFYLAESDPYRIDICEHCNRYLKIVDERKLEPERTALMNVDDILSLPLDDLAEQEGYHNFFWSFNGAISKD